jgi:1-acyl-sn-glycerol-3-phosphate acyltransferase
VSAVAGSTLRASATIATWLVVTVLAAPVQLVAVLTNRRLANRIPHLYHRFCCWLMGARIERVGALSTAQPTLFIGNHVSWLDIMALAASAEVSFVAKREVRTWPFFGWLALLQRTVFVARDPRKVAGERDDIAERLAAGDNLVLFAEGTSSPGTRVLPFKSALFAVAQATGADVPLTIQPVSISYIRLAGMPVGRQWRDCFAWYGDMDLVPHFWRVFGLGRFTVRLEFHEALDARTFASRKALAQHCESRIAAGVAAAHAGRGKPSEPAAEDGRRAA